MSCNSCGIKFNFFHKEIGCANCGLSFCSKCLKQKCQIPNKGKTEQNVCKKCFNRFAAGSSNSENINIPPPDVFLKVEQTVPLMSPTNPVHEQNYLNLLRRLENLENPSAPPITIYQDSKLQKLRPGLSPADLQILERLERLKEDKHKVPPPTESEIRMRLANLKGENPYVEAPTKNLIPVDNRTDQQKADSLLEQFVNEREIELAQNPQEGIEARLASLREQGIRPNESSYISNLHDSSSSEEEIDKIARKIMDEVALDERTGMQMDSPEIDQSESPELPWCVICNEDGKFRCADCNQDIYCARCNDEIHNQQGETNHRVIPFRPKNNL